MDAAHREALEEAGAVLEFMQYLGCYRITERSEVRWADVFVASVKDLVEITCPQESRGRQLLTLEELPPIYFQWNSLIAEVFAYSREVLDRQLEMGARLSS